MTTQSRDDQNFPFPAFRFGTTHVVPYTDTAAAMSGAIGDTCRLALVWCSTDAHILVGAAPVADTDDKPVTGKVDSPVVVRAGEKISAVRQATSGTMYVTELL